MKHKVKVKIGKRKYPRIFLKDWKIRIYEDGKEQRLMNIDKQNMRFTWLYAHLYAFFNNRSKEYKYFNRCVVLYKVHLSFYQQIKAIIRYNKWCKQQERNENNGKDRKTTN